MHTDILLQQIHAAQIDSKRLQDALNHEQLRIARATQPSLTTRILSIIGTMLIIAGERLHHAPTPSTQKRMTVTRTA